MSSFDIFNHNAHHGGVTQLYAVTIACAGLADDRKLETTQACRNIDETKQKVEHKAVIQLSW